MSIGKQINQGLQDAMKRSFKRRKRIKGKQYWRSAKELKEPELINPEPQIRIKPEVMWVLTDRTGTMRMELGLFKTRGEARAHDGRYGEGIKLVRVKIIPE